ncbi:BMP-binding endothelial regulator protein-like [Tribolium madens]|uniref:BMP-binding endothelial regulator protein-like n=1 Tax=Tribolium madens TaxID=41895 RepID=UPI001CF735D2|nr:BMP-binding endothelial regulator protein-like [Tribolium madens]
MEKRLRFIRLASFVIVLGISSLTDAMGQLQGRRAKCAQEGQPIAVDHIDKSKCYSCICQNGLVECKREYCPPTEGCHMLVEKTEDGCCRKCKGCIYNQVHHSSHTEWTDPDNPCKVLRCEAGIITVSDLQCYTPCVNPLPPEPGKCCRTCPECKINGQEATDDRDVISDDPCLKCRCHKGRMTCAKKACPVLQCSPTSQVYPPGECCPVCRGTRVLMNVPKSCRVQTSFIWEDHKFNIDKCTNCTCINETSICQRAACPVLDCAPDLQKSVPGSCCKQCIIPQEVRMECRFGDHYYEDGQSWKLDACRSCKCHRGRPSCAMTRCNVTLPCAPGTKLVHLPGECCDKCVEVEGVCMVFGDPHYKTFDGKIYTFQGIGKYLLVSDTKTQSFSIRVANDFFNKTFKNAIITKRVAIRYEDFRFNLQQKGRVKLNRKKLTLPYKKEGKVSIEKRNGNVEVTFQNGVKIFWNGKSFLEVTVPAVFKNKLSGLCGNFNGNVQDEFKTRKGHVFKDSEVLAFGAAWCAGSRASCMSSHRSSRQLARMSVCTNHQKNQKNRCKYLNKSEFFGECESKLNYFKYYKTCKMDMCKCPTGRCYCDSLMAYARECEKLGVKVAQNWKIDSLCHEETTRPKMTSRRPVFTHVDIERYKRQKNLTKTRSPILIH